MINYATTVALWKYWKVRMQKKHLLDDKLSSVYALPGRHKWAIFYFVHCIGSTGLTMMLNIIYIMKNGTPDTIPLF